MLYPNMIIGAGLMNIDPLNIICTIVNIVFLIVLMRIFLYKPIQKILDKRKEEIESGYKEADEQKAHAAKLVADCSERSAKLQEEADSILAKAREDAQNEYNRIIDEANEQAEKIREEARNQALLERAEIFRSMEAQMADLVVTAASKVVGEANTRLINQNLYDQFIKSQTSENDDGPERSS